MNDKQYIVVDAGNTRVKVAVFQNDELIKIQVFSQNDDFLLKQALVEARSQKSILSSVVSEERKLWLTENLDPDIILSDKTALPISLDAYETKSSLGADRIANVVAGHHLAKKNNTLVVDIGTCVKFDFINKKGNYQGGSISPGWRMRFKSMHDYTGQLPLIEEPGINTLIGNSTKASMNSGVFVGMQAEIDGMITLYNQRFAPLTIFLTGGDHNLFDKGLKNTIFAENNLTITGLYLILKYNV